MSCAACGSCYGFDAEGMFGPILEPAGGLAKVGGGLAVDAQRPHRLLCETAENPPVAYECCPNRVHRDSNDCLWADPHPCVSCYCELLSQTGGGGTHQQYVWNQPVSLPPNNTCYPMKWSIGISRWVNVTALSTGSNPNTTIEIGDEIDGNPVDCSYQCRSTNKGSIRWVAHSSYTLCETTAPGDTTAFTITTRGVRAAGTSFVAEDANYSISAVGISIPDCGRC